MQLYQQESCSAELFSISAFCYCVRRNSEFYHCNLLQLKSGICLCRYTYVVISIDVVVICYARTGLNATLFFACTCRYFMMLTC